MQKNLTALALLLSTLAPPPDAFSAGNVAMEVTSATLFLTGDSGANQIRVSDDDNDGFWVVTGIGGTLINGHPSRTTTDVVDSMRIDLRDGDDGLKLSGGTLAGSLTIWQGNGDDRASVSNTTVVRSLDYTGSDGSDTVMIKELVNVEPGFYSSIDMLGLTGTDKVKIKGFTGWGLDVRLGDGNDRCVIANLDLPIEGFSYLALSSYGGSDHVMLKSLTTQYVSVDLGDGDGDLLKISGSTAADHNLAGGLGINDRLLLSDDNALGAGTPSGFEN